MNMNIVSMEITEIRCTVNEKLLGQEIPTICGLTGRERYDDSMDIVYGMLPTGVVYFNNIIKIVTEGEHNNTWYAYAFNCKNYGHYRVELRDGATHGSMTTAISFSDFAKAFKEFIG